MAYFTGAVLEACSVLIIEFTRVPLGKALKMDRLGGVRIDLPGSLIAHSSWLHPSPRGCEIPRRKERQVVAHPHICGDCPTSLGTALSGERTAPRKLQSSGLQGKEKQITATKSFLLHALYTASHQHLLGLL